MFSSLRNYSLNLPRSERIYYENYDYYNTFQNLEATYKDDLSKLVYHSSRRSCPIIVNYTSNPSHIRVPHTRTLTLNNETMESFVNPLINILIENNYLNVYRSSEKLKPLSLFSYLEFGRINDAKYKKDHPVVLLSREDLSTVLGSLKEICAGRISQLEEDFEDCGDNAIVLETHYSFELFANKILEILSGEEETEGSRLLYEFTIEVHRLMWEILQANMRTILLFAQPKIPFLNHLLHPLLLPLTSFLKYNHRECINPQNPFFISDSPPKIVLLNLDGKESSHNIRNIKALAENERENFMYVSLFNEASIIKKKTAMENNFSEEVTFMKLCEIMEEEILKEFWREDEREEKKEKCNILLFPLNSTIVYRKYLKKFYEESEMRKKRNIGCFGEAPTRKPKFSSIDNSEDIHFLFEQIIFEEIRSFEPTIIFISYNGQLNISEDYFNDIVRECSVMSDHRVLLFPNFTHFFESGPFPIPNEEREEEGADKILCISQFYQKYFDYEVSNINLEKLYSNIANFLKYAPGIYSLGQKPAESPFSKTLIANRYNYCEILKSLPEFSFFQPYCLRKWSSDELEHLYSQEADWLIKENKKEHEYYDKLISVVISEFLCENITEEKLQSILTPKILFQRKLLAESLIRNQTEEKEILRSLIMDCTGEEPENFYDEKSVVDLLRKNLFEKKKNLLLQNYQNYKIKKYFHLSEEGQKNYGDINCFKFTMGKEQDQEELFLEKYSQILINDETEQIFIVNYRTTDNRHLILSGSTKNGQIEKNIVMSEVDEGSDEISTELEQHSLSEQGLIAQKQDIVYVQYNHCFYKNVLYLFWPLMWNLKEEVRFKLMDCEYRPQRVYKMLRISLSRNSMNENEYICKSVKYRPSPSEIKALPKWGCTCFPYTEDQFLIMGGIYGNEDDYRIIDSGLAHAHISFNQEAYSFTINGVEKKRAGKNSIQCLRPKINYRWTHGLGQSLEYTIRLYGGYGREWTAFYSIFSFDQYDLDVKKLAYRSLFESKTSRRVIQPEKPFNVSKIGKFFLNPNNQSLPLHEEKFSDLPKQKFIFERRNDILNKTSEWQIFGFIDDTYRVNDFKTDLKKVYLFGFNQTIREKIFSKCWSPELYIVDGIKEYIVNLSLKTEKTYMVASYIMPREEDIISLYLDEDKIYVLSNSPIVYSIERPGARFVLYDGSLSNINEVLRKKEILMGIKFTFNEKCDKFLQEKTIFVSQQRIYLVGGLSVENEKKVCVREDYILEKNKNKMKIKIRNISSERNLDMPLSHVVHDRDNYLLYSIVYHEIEDEMSDETESWKLKIEQFPLEPNECDNCKVLVGELKVYFFNNKSNKMLASPYPSYYLEKPKFVSILPYERFNLERLREGISKVIWRMEEERIKEMIKKSETLQKNLEKMKSLYNEKSDEKTHQLLLEEGPRIFEDLIKILNKKSEDTYEPCYLEEELLKDLKFCYCFVNKFMIERKVSLPPHTAESEYRFIIEDKSSKKVKYIAIGPLYSTKINFFRIRFKNELMLCLNQNKDDGFFFHPIELACEQIESDSMKSKSGKEFCQEEQVFPLHVQFKQ